jgi:hypothetical protein
MSDSALSVRYRMFRYQAQSDIADHRYRVKCPPMIIGPLRCLGFAALLYIIHSIDTIPLSFQYLYNLTIFIFLNYFSPLYLNNCFFSLFAKTVNQVFVFRPNWHYNKLNKSVGESLPVICSSVLIRYSFICTDAKLLRYIIKDSNCKKY